MLQFLTKFFLTGFATDQRRITKRPNRRTRLALLALEDRNCPSGSQVTIVGGLSNFDCTNNTGSVENEFEIELPNVKPSDISGFWANTPYYKGSGYGLPTETFAPSSDHVAGHMSTYVDYKRAGISTPDRFTEHFGVHFVNPTFMPGSTIYTWKDNGVAANYPLPSVSVTTTPNASGGQTITPVVVNNTNVPFVVRFHTTVVNPASAEGVQLGDLVDSNAEVRLAEAEPEAGDNGRLGVTLLPGQVLGVDGEAHDSTDPIIVNPAAWLAANPGQGISFDSDLNQPGESALATLVITDTAGNPVSEAFSAINTIAPPSITTNPTNQSGHAGQTVTFVAAATSTVQETVQWQTSSNGILFADIPGATSTSYSIVARAGLDGHAYRAVFTNSAGAATTSYATFTYTYAPQIALQPTSTIVAVGSNATFTANASANPAAAVQWQVKTKNGNAFVNIPSATSTTLRFATTLADSGNEYRAVFSNSVGTATTQAAKLTVDVPPAIGTQPASTTAVAGRWVTFSAAATGTSPTAQWQTSTDGGATFRNIPGAVGLTLNVYAAPASNGYEYRAVFTNPVGVAKSNAAILTVNYAPKVTATPQSQTIAVGATATFTATADSNPAAAVQWQVSTNNGYTFANIAGATSTTLSFATTLAESGYLYRAVFSNSVGTATTQAAKLTVDVPPAIGTQPASTTAVAGRWVTFSAAATGTAPTVQWQTSTDGGATFRNIPGAVGLTLNVYAAPASNGYEYRAVFTNPVGVAKSNAAILTVNYAPKVTATPQSQTIAVGATVTFTASADSNPAAAVQWQVSTNNGSTFVDIAGATSTTLSFATTLAENGYLYRAVFSNSVGKATTQAAKLTVDVPPAIGTQPASTTAVAGRWVTFSAAATGTAPTVQWQASTDGGVTFHNIPGAIGLTLNVYAAPASNGYEYRAVFTNPVGVAKSNAAILTVNYAPKVTATPQSQTVAVGATATFTASADSNPTAAVQWQVSTDKGYTFANIAGATSTTLSFASTLAESGYLYRAVFSNSVGAATTQAAKLTVDVPPSIASDPASQTAKAGTAVTFTASAIGTAPRVQWQISVDGGTTFVDYVGANSTSLHLTAKLTQNGYKFRAVFSNPVGQVKSAAATLTVTP